MSSTSDRIGTQAMKVNKDLQGMGNTVGDAAEEQLAQVGEKSLGIPGRGARQCSRCRVCVQTVHSPAAAGFSLGGGRHRQAGRPLSEARLMGDVRMAPSDPFVKSAWVFGFELAPLPRSLQLPAGGSQPHQLLAAVAPLRTDKCP